MLGLSLKTAKGNFFDRAKVIAAMDAAARRVLSRFGAFVRQRAKTSIRKRKGVSPVGGPPYSHVGLLRKFILFAYDSGSKSVVIGPTLLTPTSDAPSLLEYGGRRRVLAPGTGRPASQRYRARPYMRPAFEQEKSRLPDLWKNSIRP